MGTTPKIKNPKSDNSSILPKSFNPAGSIFLLWLEFCGHPLLMIFERA
jgi:hypothetical protein